MADKPTHGTDLSEQRVREIVQEELSREPGTPKSRRRLLGTLGVIGAAGLAGAGLRNSSKQDAPQPDSAGDHRQYNRSADTPQSTELEGTTSGGSTPNQREYGYVARRNGIQTALDDAYEDGVGRVSLEAGTVHTLSETIYIPPTVSLDCTGARVQLGADVNAFALETQSRILHPQVRTTPVDGYSSTIFHVNPTERGEPFGTNRPVPTWTVFGGWSEMTPGEGTCIELHGKRENPDREYDVVRDNRNVYFCFVAHNCIGGRRFAYLHREGGETTRGGHVNGNIIKGFAAETTRFVETDDTATGKNMVNGNKFHLATQPGSDSEWLWYANKGTRNELREWGTNWDYVRYKDSDGDGYGESWYIGPNAGKNYVWRRSGSASGGLGSTVVDDSSGESGSKYLILDELGVPVDDLRVWDDAE